MISKPNAERTAQLRDLLYRKGRRDTREIAEYLGLSMAATRRLLNRLHLLGVIEQWDGRGVSINNCDLWSNVGQVEPMDPMTRLKEGYQPPRVFVLHCKRLTRGVPDPQVEHYDVEVTVVPQTKSGDPDRDQPDGQTRWRAYSREWGVGRPGYGSPKTAALELANKPGVMASVAALAEVEDIFGLVPPSAGSMQEARP